jgi:hypothetical protein
MPSATPVSLLVIVCILIMASQNGSLYLEFRRDEHGTTASI